MQNKNVTFDNDAGQSLSGILSTPAEPPRAYALFAHCFTCGKNLKAANHIARALVDAGIAVLRFDFTGLGQSEGDFADTNFSSNVADLIAAARWLESSELARAAPSILIGHSLGGTAVLQAAAALPSAVAVATIGSPADPLHVRHLLSDAEAELRANGEAEVNLGERPFRMRAQFLDDLERHALPEAVGKLRKALTTAAAGRAQLVADGDHDDLDDLALARRHHAANCARLGALALRIGDVLDIAGGEQLAARRPQAGPDLEAGVGRVRSLAGLRRKLDHALQLVHRSFT